MGFCSDGLAENGLDDDILAILRPTAVPQSASRAPSVMGSIPEHRREHHTDIEDDASDCSDPLQSSSSHDLLEDTQSTMNSSLCASGGVKSIQDLVW
jgi:hypothetical protein